MDPNATLAELLMCIRNGQRREAIDYLVTLTTWLRRGGFLPTMQNPQVQAQLRAALEEPK